MNIRNQNQVVWKA